MSFFVDVYWKEYLNIPDVPVGISFGEMPEQKGDGDEAAT